MGPSGRFTHIVNILAVWDRYLQVLYLGRAPRTKETLPDFLKWRRVTRRPLVFRGLTGSQRTPGFWGVTTTLNIDRDEHVINLKPFKRMQRFKSFSIMNKNVIF